MLVETRLFTLRVEISLPDLQTPIMVRWGVFVSRAERRLTRAQSTPARRRLLRDFRKMSKEPTPGISAAPLPNDIMTWNAVIFGPTDTPWEGGTFRLAVTFDEDFPNKAPKVVFLTKVFHPNGASRAAGAALRRSP